MELPCNQVLLWQQSGRNQLSPNTAIVNYYQVRVCPGSHDIVCCVQCCHSDIYSHALTQLLIVSQLIMLT